MAAKKDNQYGSVTIVPPVVSRPGRESSISEDVLRAMADDITEEVWVTPSVNGEPLTFSPDQDYRDKYPDKTGPELARRLSGNAVAQYKRPLFEMLKADGRVEDPYDIKSKSWAIDEDGETFVIALRLRAPHEYNEDNGTEDDGTSADDAS